MPKETKSVYEENHELMWLSRFLTVVCIGAVLVAYNFMTKFDKANAELNSITTELEEEHKQRVYAEEKFKCLHDEFVELQEVLNEK